MSLFKNEVGRPSNETKRKRRIFYSLVVLLGIITVGIGSFALYNTLTYQPIEGNNKNAIWSLIDKILNVGKKEAEKITEVVEKMGWTSFESNGVTVAYTQPKPDSDLPLLYYTEWYISKNTTNKKLYSNIQTVVNGKSTFLGCKQAATTVQQVIVGVPENGTVGFVYNIYSDSSCKKLISGMESHYVKQDSYPRLIIENAKQDLDGYYVANETKSYPLLFKYNGNKTYYYKLNSMISGSYSSRGACTKVEAGKKLLNLPSNKNAEFKYSVFSDSRCNTEVKSDTIKVKDKASNFFLRQPSELNYIDAEVFIYYGHNYNKDLYVKATNYNGSKVSYNYSCHKLSKNQEKSISFYVNKNNKEKYSVIEVFYDSSCTHRAKKITTSLYEYNFWRFNKGTITKNNKEYFTKKY